MRNGQRFDFLDEATWSNLTPDVAAHALARQNRYVGHSIRPYNVAMHSVVVSYLTPPEFALEGLIHDMPEAVMGDINSPLKHLLMLDPFRELEDRIMAHILVAHGRNPVLPRSVHIADKAAGVAEMITNTVDFDFGGPLPDIVKRALDITPFDSPEVLSRQRWIERYEELTA